MSSCAHNHSVAPRRVLLFAVCLTLTFAAVEFFGGRLAGSLALVADAGHMLTDSMALALAALAAWIARRPPSKRRTWGYGRAEVLAALINGTAMLVLVGLIAWQALSRFKNPRPVSGGMVLAVAVAGLAINLLVFRLLSRAGDNLNVRGALLHVLGDLLGSVAVIISAVVILWTGWTHIDPILSLVICALMLVAAVRLLAEGAHVVLNGVPPGLNVEDVRRTLLGVPEVLDVHDLHVWQIASGRSALSAHVMVDDPARWFELLEEISRALLDRHGIKHITLQPESTGADECLRLARACF